MALVLVRPSSQAQTPGGFAVTQRQILAVQNAQGPVLSQPPVLTADEIAERAARMQEREFDRPFLVDGPLATGRRTTPPMIDTPSIPAGDQPFAATDFVVQRSHDLTEISSFTRSTVHEPSVANSGDTVFFTANWYAARSADGGRTFTYVNPATTFPSVNGGFCCDQVVHYAPSQDMMIWALQYIKSSGTNTLRIALAVGPSQVAANSWRYLSYTPQYFGFATGHWLDFPNLTVTTNYLYATSNVYRTANDTFAGSVVWRMPLAQLAAGGTVQSDSVTFTDVATMRCTEGATTTAYCGSVRTTQSIRIFRWPDGDPYIYWDDRTVLPFTWMSDNGSSQLADGTNWAARADSRMLGAWVAGGVIGFMWMAKNDADFPHPYTIITRFNESNRAKISDQAIWSSTRAWLYPTASPNARGHVGGLIFAGGGSTYPLAQFWVIDDVETGVGPVGTHFAASSSAGPAGNAWGDYVSVRKHRDFPNSWVAGLFYMGAGGRNSNAVARYSWFGRSRDLPVGPSITTHPTSQTIAAGQSATLSVTAAGTAPFSYQWYGGPIGSTTPVSGATSSSYTTPSLTSAAQYYVRVWSDYGTTYSNTATISLGTRPTITTQPLGQTVASGQLASLSVNATGMGTLSYQWYQGASGVTTAPIAGGTSAALNAGPVTVPAYFWVRVSNPYGFLDSGAALVRVTFTDPTLVAGTTAAKAAHILELRARVNNVRLTAGLPLAVWTDPTLMSGFTFIRVIHITELRSAVNGVYAARGLTAPAYSDPALSSGWPIRTVHLAELRQAVIALEP